MSVPRYEPVFDDHNCGRLLSTTSNHRITENDEQENSRLVGMPPSLTVPLAKGLMLEAGSCVRPGPELPHPGRSLVRVA